MPLSSAELEHLETLARLKVPEAEREKMRHDIGAILAYVASLQEIDTNGVDPTFRGGALDPRLRDDAVLPVDAETTRQLIEGVPDTQDGHIRVPATLQHKRTS